MPALIPIKTANIMAKKVNSIVAANRGPISVVILAFVLRKFLDRLEANHLHMLYIE